MQQFSLTAEEFFCIELMITATDQEGSAEPLYKYFNECKKDSLPRQLIQSLKDKGVLSRDYVVPKEGERFDLDEVEFSTQFTTTHFRYAFEAGKELFDAYPHFIQFGDGRLLPARNITTKGFLSMEAFYHHYTKAIRHSAKKHQQVLDILAWAKENSLLTYGIAEYVITRKWDDHMKIRDEGGTASFIVKVDTLEQL